MFYTLVVLQFVSLMSIRFVLFFSLSLLFQCLFSILFVSSILTIFSVFYTLSLTTSGIRLSESKSLSPLFLDRLLCLITSWLLICSCPLWSRVLDGLIASPSPPLVHMGVLTSLPLHKGDPGSLCTVLVWMKMPLDHKLRFPSYVHTYKPCLPFS